MKTILGCIVLTTVLAGSAAAQDDPWSWRKAIPAGQTVEIRGIMGTIEASAATGSQVEIVARKSARSGDPSEVRIEVEEHADGVIVCAIYDGRSSCDAEQTRGNHNRNNDTRVDFEVRVPRGVQFTGKNISGDVEATGLDARVQASTVSGSVRVTTSNIASASTVSGSIDVRMGRSDWTGALKFSTVSGDIDVEFAGDLNADVELRTVSGDLDSDWPMTMNTAGRGQVRGRIGTGGRQLSFSSVSGSVELRKAQ